MKSTMYNNNFVMGITLKIW